ncbi:D-glycero-alpha-D-manno-heptose 1-phosphate guanylyltransferase [bacterium BMS3Abin06]|nr:D-glycero-alpha-D-manno-heptose 1-phosphate guanylyltransferase [bacterium BMS3Abin06]
MLQKDIFIAENESVKDVLKKLDRTAEKLLLVTDRKNRLLGTISDGDIRRYLLMGKSLEENIEDVYYKNPTFLRKGEFSMESAKKIFLKKKIDLIPVLDEEDTVVDYIIWNQAFSEEVRPPKNGKIKVPVVIMAGGKGTRLEPFTKILPKPLIPVNDKPIIELIIEEFKRQGGKKFYLILNSKGEMIEAYFNGIKKDYEVKYVRENNFLGTAGGLKLLKRMGTDLFIVSNCDVIVKADFQQVITRHKKQNAVMTVLSSIQHHKIPYGVINFREKGLVTDIHEKPEYTVTINTGVYILSREALKFIPENTFFDMTDLIKKLIENNKKVATYPVNENDYIDIGQWEEYKNAVEKLRVFR